MRWLPAPSSAFTSYKHVEEGNDRRPDRRGTLFRRPELLEGITRMIRIDHAGEYGTKNIHVG